MDKKEFKKKKYIKEKALELFPECYSRSLRVSTYYADDSLDRLKEYIIEYFENGIFNPKLVGFNADRVSDIINAYDLVKKEYYQEEKFNLKNTTVKKLFNAYNDLITNIGTYRFNRHRYGSYGDRQNKSNREILLDISMLYPVLLETLEKADVYINENSDAFRLFVAQLLEKIETWTNILKETDTNLDIAKANYHNTWSFYNRSYYLRERFRPELSLGEYKKEWKLKRNEACHTIYEFYQDIMMINKAIGYESIDVDESSYSLEVSETEALYNYAMENIVTGPNYYCYLNEDEKEEDMDVNILKKMLSRKCR